MDVQVLYMPSFQVVQNYNRCVVVCESLTYLTDTSIYHAHGPLKGLAVPIPPSVTTIDMRHDPRILVMNGEEDVLARLCFAAA